MSIKIYKKLHNIINDNRNEYRPLTSCKKWRDVEYRDMNYNPEYKVFRNNINVIEYTITNKLIKEVEKYTDVYKKLDDPDKDLIIDRFNDNVGIIFMAKNELNERKYVGNTIIPLISYIKLNLHKRNLNKYNVFDNLIDDPNNHDLSVQRQHLKNINFKVIEYIKYNNNRDVHERTNYWKEKYMKKSMIPFPEEDAIYQKRITTFTDTLIKNKQNSFTGYIFFLRNRRNRKMFIGGLEKKITKDELMGLLKNKEFNNDIDEFGKKSFEFAIFDEYDAKSKYDFMLRIDFYKSRLDTIKNGYNSGYNMAESEILWKKNLPTRARERLQHKFFLMMQKKLFEKNFVDNNDYTDIYSFVYQIQHKKNKMKYISVNTKGTLKDSIINLYKKGIKKNVKNDKIIKALGEEPYDKFTFKILKKKSYEDFNMDIGGEAEKLISKWNTIGLGYNVGIGDIRSKIISSKKKNKLF